MITGEGEGENSWGRVEEEGVGGKRIFREGKKDFRNLKGREKKSGGVRDRILGKGSPQKKKKGGGKMNHSGTKGKSYKKSQL